MQTRYDPDDVRLALVYLRVVRGWKQAEVARRAGVAKSLISLYEQGKRKPSEKSLKRLLAAFETRPSAFEEIIGVVKLVRVRLDTPGEGPARLADGMGHVTAAAANLAVARRAAAAYYLSAGLDELPEEARADAADLWERFASCSREDQELLIRELPEFHNLGLFERLCEESAGVARENAGRAVELAELAIEIATRIPVRDNRRLQAYGWAHLAHGRREAGDLPGAEEAFARARELWAAGAPDDVDSGLSGRFLNLLIH